MFRPKMGKTRIRFAKQFDSNMNKEKKYTVCCGAERCPHRPVSSSQVVGSNIAVIQESAAGELERLLKTHPELAELQDEIERLLQNSGPFENRMAVLGLLIEAKLQELQNRISRLFPAD